jgi:hypothetical protein
MCNAVTAPLIDGVFPVGNGTHGGAAEAGGVESRDLAVNDISLRVNK